MLTFVARINETNSITMMKLKLFLLSALVLSATGAAKAQSELYPKHFNLEQVTLLDGPMKTAM